MNRPVRAAWLALALAWGSGRAAEPPAGAAAAAAAEPTQAPRALVVERIELVGNTRTPLELAVERAGIAEGDAASPAVILAAHERLEASGLFHSVAVHTKPGSTPGRVTIVFEVEEAKPHVRLGVGYEDLTGWYLIPAQLNLDNVSGHGETLRLSTRIGYRTSGVVASFRKARWNDPLTYFGIEAYGGNEDRIYFAEGAEIVHRVARGGLVVRGGRRLSGPFAIEASLGVRTADAEEQAEVYRERRAADAQEGDPVAYDDLPAAVRDDVEKLQVGELGIALVVDSREGEGLTARGVWGRLGVAGALSDSVDYSRAEWDVRGYVPFASGGQIALRTRGGSVTEAAPFYERYYVGGLYTIRGYPSQALTPPGGDLNFLTASVELRGPLIGAARSPRLAAVAFLDTGLSWSKDGERERFTGIGYGVRLRVPWLGYLGLDVGLPVDDSPLGESFHLNGSLGWTF